MKMNPSEHDADRAICALTERYLREVMLRDNGFDPALLDKYLLPDALPGALSLAQLYERVLLHAQNTSIGGGDMQHVFGNAYSKNEDKVQRWAKLRELLAGFEPRHTAAAYQTVGQLIADVEKVFPDTPLKVFSLRFCLTIFDAARFLAPFHSGSDFYAWVGKTYESDIRVVPQQLEAAITGMGYALSRDFLKDLGYVRYVKPDVHVLDICEWLGVIQARDVARTADVMLRIAEAGGLTPLALDRMFYLIGSGDFYVVGDDAVKAHFGRKNTVRRKQNFVRYIREKLANRSSIN